MIENNYASPAHQELVLSEVLDRVLEQGIVINGDIVISVADIDLVYLGLRLLLTSVENMHKITENNPL